MATVIRCDRCRDLMEIPCARGHVNFEAGEHNETAFGETRSADLCKSCCADLRVWLHEPNDVATTIATVLATDRQRCDGLRIADGKIHLFALLGDPFFVGDKMFTPNGGDATFRIEP